MCYEILDIQGEMQAAVVPELPARLGSFRKLRDRTSGQDQHRTANPGLERAKGGNQVVAPGSMTTGGCGPQVCNAECDTALRLQACEERGANVVVGLPRRA